MRSHWPQLSLMMLTSLFLALSCSKGKSTVEKSKENSNYTAKAAKNYINIPARYTFSDNIEFFVETNNGVPLPSIGSEFRAFDITAMYEGGTTINPEKIPVMLKTFQDNWNTNLFNLTASGEISTKTTCEYATSREACVGDLTGSSVKTDRDGRAFTGYKSPDGPGSIVAVVLKVPEGSSASNLMQYATIQIQAWSNWGKNGESPLEATLLLVPQLENDDGEPVVKAGVGFSVNLIIPGIPSTPKGQGFLFDIETTGVENVDNDRVVVPSGKNVLCNFRGGLCSLPGGPFKVLSPTIMSITVKPSDPNFPVRTANVTIPVITGRARTIMLSTTFPAKKITNICLSEQDFSKPCMELTADIDEIEVFPFLADEGGNYVGSVPTEWSASGPLGTRLESEKVTTSQKIKPLTTGSGIIDVTTEKGISGKFTYVVRSGAPAKVQFKTEHSVGSNSIEKVGVPFKIISTLYDRKDNLCIDYNTTFGIKLKLSPVYAATPPPGIAATAALVDEIDQTATKILVTRGIGTTSGSFSVAKVPDVSGGQSLPTISTLDSTLPLAIVNPSPITILPGPITQSQLRNSAGGLGTAWDLVVSGATGTSFANDRAILVRSDQQYYFNNAGYDAGGNYVMDVPSKFWGVSYIYHPSTQGSFNGLVAGLKDKDPSAYNDATTCHNPVPNAEPSTSSVPTNQPEGNKVYCGVHRGLETKQGVSSPLASVGIPGSGRVLAIPLDSTIQAAISPILNVTSGLATKIKIELVDTNPPVNPPVLANPIVAGKEFKIRLSATDDYGSLAADFVGSKTFDFSSSASPSWGGVQPVLPDGSKTCTFVSGVCTLDDPYVISRGTGTTGVLTSQTITSIALEQVIPNGELGVTGIHTQFIRSVPGPEKFIFFTDKKGGVGTNSIALHALTLPGGISILASQEYGFGVAIADGSGNFIRDMSPTDNIYVKGFEGSFTDLTKAPDNFFNFATGVASSASWPPIFTQNDLLTANATPPAGIDPTPKKFYDPSVPADLSKISTLSLKDASLYSLVLSPQNRVGKAFAVPYSLANTSLVGWPSPNIEIKPGLVDHVATDYFDPNDNTVNNTNAVAGDCKNLKFRLSDAKGNQLINYTTVTNMRVKIFKVDGTHPNGVDDPKVNVSPLTASEYSVLNRSEIPGPTNSGFDALSGIGGQDSSLEAQAKSVGGSLQSTAGVGNTTAVYSAFRSDWWYGSVSVNSGLITFPGVVCFQTGQTLANRTTTPVSQHIVQVEIEPSTYANSSFNGLISRGANRVFSSTYGSTSLGSGHNDIITVSRGSAHHLHGAYVDNYQDPKLAWMGPTGSPNVGGISSVGDELGLESPCPYPRGPAGAARGGCGSKTIYWHIHDKACNYIGPATGVVAEAVPNTNMSNHILTGTSVGLGPQGSAGLLLGSPDNYASSISSGVVTESIPAFVSSGSLRGAWYAKVFAGKPNKLVAKLTNSKGTLNADDEFSINFELQDQFNNAVTPANWDSFSGTDLNPYSTLRSRRVWTDVLPSNAPTGEPPVYEPTSGNKVSWTHSSYGTAFHPSSMPGNVDSSFVSVLGAQFRRANEPITFTAELKDQASSAWCAIAGNCLTTGVQTYTTTIGINMTPGAAVAATIRNSPSLAGLPYKTANYSSIFSPLPKVYPLIPNNRDASSAYGCLLDQYQNVFNCFVNSSWSVVNKLDKSGVATTANILGGAQASVQDPNAALSFVFSAFREGSAQIRVDHSGFTALSDPIQVWAGPLERLSIQTGGVADNSLAPSVIAVGQEIPTTICLRDGADNIIDTQVIHGAVLKTDPAMPFTVNFVSKVPVNSEGNGLVLSTGTGANFDSQIFSQGAKSTTFVNGCVTVYIKNYASGNVAGNSLLTVSTVDPLRPGVPIEGADGLYVSQTTPGVLDHFATLSFNTSNSPVSGTVPAWSNVQANAGYANAGGNRFDLRVVARDFYGNDLPTTAAVTLSRIKSDGTTPVTRPLVCSGETSIAVTTCSTANLSGVSQVNIPSLASDIAGSMYIVASSGAITTKTSVSQLINFQASVKTVKDYTILNLQPTVTAGQQFSVQIAATDNTGAPVTGADDVLSAATFSAVDQNDLALSTHKSPNNTAPTIPSTYTFVTGTAYVPFTLTKKELLQFRVKDSTGKQSSLGNIDVQSSVGLSYQISCRLASDDSDCSGTQAAPYQMAASRANLFNLIVENIDIYGNKKAGSSSLYLSPVRISGPTGVAMLRSSTAKSYIGINYDSFITFSALNENGAVVDHLYYGVPNQTISFNLPNMDVNSSITKNTFITFLPHIDAVNSYNLSNFGSISILAGTTKTFQISAIDYAGNIITGLDTSLGSQTYTWTGAGLTLGGYNNILPTSALTFTNGVSQNLTATFYHANTSLLFNVTDNFTNAVSLIHESLGVKPRSIQSVGGFDYDGSLVINAKPPTGYILSGISPLAEAGVPFTLSLSVKDIYGNPNSNWSDSLTFTYQTGASPSIATPADGTVHSATKAANVTGQSFPNGTYDVPGTPFTLYRSNLNAAGAEEMTLLHIQGTNTATDSGLALSTSINIKTTPKTAVAYAKMTTSSVYSAANNLTGLTLNYGADNIINYFGALFDQYGNFQTVSNAVSNSVQWLGTGALDNKFLPATGLTTVFSPKTRGSGVVTLNCSAIAGCISDSTGTVNVTTGPLAKFSILDNESSGSVSMGSIIPVDICMQDNVGNTIDTNVTINTVLITNPNATLNLEFRQINITDTPERPALEVSKSNGAGFNAGRISLTTGTAAIPFVNGCTQVFAKIYSTNSVFGQGLPLLRVRYDDLNQPLVGIISSLGFDVPGVSTLPLDHYVTTASNLNGGKVEAFSDLGTTNVQGSAGGNRFSILVEARDIYGNSVVRSNSVNLSMLASDGSTPIGRSLVCSAPANDTSCLSPAFSSSTSVLVNNLALDVAGNFYVNAVDSGSVGIKSSVSTLINFNASPNTIKQYRLIHPSLTNAGLATNIQVRAEDNSGSPVNGTDAALNALTFTWFNAGDSTNMTTHKAPDLTDPVLLSTLQFNGGVASAQSYFTKAETGLTLNIRDNFSPQKISNNLSTLDVQPGLSLYYDVICKKASDLSDCTGTAGTPKAMTGSAAEKFNLEFLSLDQYKNPKLGEGSARVKVNYVSGTAAQVGSLESLNSYTYYASEMEVNMASLAMVPKSNLFYRVGNQVVRMMISNTAAAGYYKTPYLSFSPTIDTVTGFNVATVLSGVAGVSKSVSVDALDSGGNTVTGIDAQLNSQTYTWSGLLQSPNFTSPVYPSASLTFSSGAVSGLSTTVVKSGVATLTLLDNYSPCGNCSNIGGLGPSNVRKGSTSPVISHAPSNSYGITGGGTSTKAGVTFDLIITALDEFENPATSWNSDTLTFSWSGANPSVSNPKNAGTFNPILATNGAKTFTAAAYSTSGSAFALYKTETPTLTVTGTTSAGTKNGTALSGTRVFTVLPNDNAGYVRLSDSPVSTAPTLSGSVFTLQTDQQKTLFGYLYDGFGNLKSDASQVAWTGSSVLAGKLSPSTSATTVFAPVTVGTGVVTASCSGITAGCISDSTGTITIEPSNVAKIVFISPSPSNNFTQLTTACQQLQVQTQDLVNNPAPVNTDTTFTFASTGGNGDFYVSSAECTTAQGGQTTMNTGTFHTSTLGGSAGNRTKVMTSGTDQISVWFANRTSVASNGAVITVSALSRTATLNATITPAVARRTSFVTTSPTVNAIGSPSNTCMTLTYRFDDIWGNQQNLASSSTINMSVTGTDQAAGIYSDSGCTASISSRTLSSGNQDTVYYKDAKANRSTFNILGSSNINGTAIQAAVNTTINVLPGVFATTQTPTIGSYTKDTVTLMWGASAGAKNYHVSYGTTSACGTVINAAATGTSVSFATGLNGTYYICLVGNSYTSGGVNTNASNYGTYYFIIDNQAPTGTITAPTLASIGPVTNEVGSGATTTFTGTAGDTGGSNLLKVELEIKTGSNYWDGSTWTTTPSVVLASGTSSWTYVMNDANFSNATTYNLRVQVTDNSLNVTTSAATRSFTWDTLSPTVNITAFGNLLSSAYYSKLTTLNTVLTTSDGAVKYKYYTVSGSSCSGGTYSGLTVIATNITANPGGDGQYTLCVLGMDLAENLQSTPTSFTWYKDTVAPVISGGVPNMGPYNSAYTPSLSAATDAGSPAGSVISYLWTVSTNASTCTTSFGSTTTENTSITSTCGNTYGTSTLNLNVSDTAGNFTNYNPTFNWDQETRFISSISSSLSSVAKKAGDTIDITVTFSKSGGNTNSGSITVNTTGGTPTLALNTTPARTATYVSTSGSTLTFNYVVQAGDNQATLNVANASAFSLNGATIKDAYNNNVSVTAPTNSLNTRSITVDTVAPTLSATGYPTGESNATSLNVAISATDTTSYTYSVVSGTSAACPGTQSGTTPRATNITNNISGLAEGNVTICARATDAAGNVQSGYTSYTWIKDTVAPAVVTGITPSVEVNTLTPTITWNAAAGDVVGIWLTIFKNTALTTKAYEVASVLGGGTTSAVSGNLAADGKYFICLYTRDLAGNQSSCAQQIFTVETDTLHTSWLESSVVKYGLKTNTSAWATSTAASGAGTYQGRTSVLVDPSGNPLISYSYNNGTTDSYFRYSRWNGSSWAASAVQQTSTSNLNGGTLGESVVASTTFFHSGFYALDAASGAGVEYLKSKIADNAQISMAQAFSPGPSSSITDISAFVDDQDKTYIAATSQYGSSYQVKVMETTSLNEALLALPAGCNDMPYVSGVSKKTGSSFVLAGLCVMSDATCKVWYGQVNYASPTFTLVSWTNPLVVKTSACTVGSLTLANRPIIMQDKQLDKTAIVVKDITNNSIVKWHNESGTWASENVVTGLTGTSGYPFIAYDQYSKSYVTYLNNSILYMIHNNGRETGLFTGGWNTATQISNTAGMSGFGGISLTGLKGRGNYTGGK